MSPLQFQLEVLGEVQVERDFLRFGERALSAGPLWNEIHQDLLMIERVQFLTEGAHGSGGWAELKAATVAAKKAKGLEPWIERATERLFRSLASEGDGHIFENLDSMMRFGTSVSYAGFQQHGTRRGLPQRRLVQLTGAERVGLAKSVQRFIMTGEATRIL